MCLNTVVAVRRACQSQNPTTSINAGVKNKATLIRTYATPLHGLNQLNLESGLRQPLLRCREQKIPVHVTITTVNRKAMLA